jgi:uncharacterized membrane protein YfcA
VGVYHYVLLAVIGLVAGLAGGLLGIGGSIVMIPGMNELFGPRQHLHQAAAMIVNFFVVVPAVYQHYRAGAIVWPVVKWMAPAAVVAVLLGVGASELPLFAGPNRRNLVLVFAAFLAFIALRDLYRMFRRPADEPAKRPEATPAWKAAVLVGLPAGFVAGLLGVGGGIVMVPLQRRVLRMPIRQAIANSATAIILLAPVGAALKNYAVITRGLAPWWTTFALAAVLIPTAMIAASFGGKLTHTLPVRRIRLAFVILLLICAARMVIRAWEVT